MSPFVLMFIYLAIKRMMAAIPNVLPLFGTGSKNMMAILCVLCTQTLAKALQHYFQCRCIDSAPVSKVIRELGIPNIICEQYGSIHCWQAWPCNPLIILAGSEKTQTAYGKTWSLANVKSVKTSIFFLFYLYASHPILPILYIKNIHYYISIEVLVY